MARLTTALCAAAVVWFAATTAHADADQFVASVSGLSVSAPDGQGALDELGRGGAVSVAWFMGCGCLASTLGVEASGLFLAGDGDDVRFYDFGLSVVGSSRLTGDDAALFLSFGIDASAVTASRDGATRTEPSMGVHGNAGIHGFFGDFYWRGQVGYIGAAVAGIKTELALGYRFGGL